MFVPRCTTCDCTDVAARFVPTKRHSESELMTSMQRFMSHASASTAESTTAATERGGLMVSAAVREGSRRADELGTGSEASAKREYGADESDPQPSDDRDARDSGVDDRPPAGSGQSDRRPRCCRREPEPEREKQQQQQRQRQLSDRKRHDRDWERQHNHHRHRHEHEHRREQRHHLLRLLRTALGRCPTLLQLDGGDLEALAAFRDASGVGELARLVQLVHDHPALHLAPQALG